MSFIASLASELESIQSEARRAKLIAYSRLIVLDRDGAKILASGRDKHRTIGSLHPKFVHNARSVGGEYILREVGSAASELQARMIVAGFMALFAAQCWETELYDAKTDWRYKPSARPYLKTAVRERVTE